MHNYFMSVYEDGVAKSTLITMVQAPNHAKHGIDILSDTRVRSTTTLNQVFLKRVRKEI